MSGYGNKGPGWGRGPGGMPPHLMGVNNDFGGGGMLQQGLPLQQQGMGLAGMAPGMPVTTQQGAPVGISYPPRAVNPGGFPPAGLLQQQQQQQVVMGGGGGGGGPGGQQGQRVFTGTVTKLHDSFGFVDDEVFFQTTVCKGPVPKVQDRVLVEASFNPNMPFKWNATRVQVLPNQSAGGGGNFSGNMGGRQNQQQGGGGGGGGGGFQSTNQLGSAFGDGGGPGGNRGGNNDRNTRFDGGMRNNRNDNMRGGHGGPGGGGGGMRGGNDIDIRGGHGGNDRGQDRNQRQRSPPRQRQRNNDREDNRGGRDMNIDRSEMRNERQERQRDWKEREERDKDSMPRGSRKRSRSPSRRSRSPVGRRSRSRSRSPPRRRARATPRYSVSVPKVSLKFPNSTVMDLKKRYSNLYIPSDFFNANHAWNDAYPIHEPFEIEYGASYHVFNKDLVESPLTADSKWQLEAPDADYTWVAKVMLLASPNIEELFEKTCHFIDKDARDRDDLVHPSRALKFLVGLKEKREIMAIGGPWSPSLDGANPGSDPTTLINTAIRTCGALTGIDLSSCTRWTKFLKIHYRRQASSSKPARTETVVIFFPDIWSAMPTKIEYDGLCEQYGQACKLKQEGKSLASMKETTETNAEQETTGGEPAAPAEDEEMETEAGEGPGEATHWSQLDTKAMKVVELRAELEARGQPSKGVKLQLAAKLQECLDNEKEAEEKKAAEENAASEDQEKPENGNTEPEQEKSEENKEGEEPSKEASEEVTIVLDERQKEKLASAYKTPSGPCIFVHPNSKAKSGKFDCRVESLSVLLDYRTDDNKEGTFEVSLFAELFNEMLTRDSAFKIYQALVNAPEKVKEDKKKEEKKEDKKEDKKEEKSEVEEVAAEASETPATEEVKPEDKPAEEEQPREASVEITEEKEKVLVTKNKKLLFGCSFFDQSHCGYIESKDVEDILMTLELELSRAEVKKISGKLASKDQVNYRQLVDGEEGVETQTETDNGTSENLARGFKQFVPGCEESSTASSDKGATVTYKGSVVDVGKLQNNLDKSEKVRRATDQKLIEIQKKYSSTKDSNEKLEKSRDKLSTEVKDLKKKVRSLEDELKRSQDSSGKHFSILTEFYNKVKPIVAPPEKTEEKSTETIAMVNGVSEAKEEKVKEEELTDEKVASNEEEMQS